MITRTLRHIATALMLAATMTPVLGASLPQPTAVAQQQQQPEQPVAEEHGQGWYAAAICVGCLTAAGITLYTGAAAWATLVASPSTTVAAITLCVTACNSAYGET